MKDKLTNVRLSYHIRPERYELFLRPNLTDFTFSGEEIITLELDKPTKEITLHLKEIEVGNVSWTDEKDSFLPKEISYNSDLETVTFIFNEDLSPGKRTLHLKFKGILNDQMRGFYRSRYKIGERECFMATTQFESTDARRAFPCFDEPSQKAIFDITLIIPENCTAVSNTLPEIVKEHDPGFKAVKFSPTPKMSTYLVAFIVGDLEFIEDKTERGVVVRVFTVPGKIEQAGFALAVAKRALSFYEDYFEIPYPLPALDLIAIPDFASGAMENWGAITYRESALLVDEKHSSLHNKRWVAIVIAHEIAHQWFGNLVTMEWWTHLWLNEGFASYVEYLAVDHLFPEWDIWTQFVHTDLDEGLELDALKNTHPIEIEVHHPSEIEEVFDKISYSKGASIIRMLAEYLGEKVFRDGLRHYLKKHSYANAETDDLWMALEHVSGKPVREMMRGWTANPGYPLIKLIERNGKLEFEQSRFFASAISRKENSTRTFWQVPVSVRRGGSEEEELIFMDGPAILVNSLKEKEWLKINAGETGFFRVFYPPRLLKALKDPIRNKTLGAKDRLGVVRDSFALGGSCEASTVEALELLDAYLDEDDYSVWVEIATSLSDLSSLIAHESFQANFHSFARRIFEKVAQKLGWDSRKDEKNNDSLLRPLVLSNLGSYGDEKVIEKAREVFRRNIEDGITIHPDLRGAVYKIVAENGGMKEYEIFMRLHKETELHEEKNRIERVVGHFRDKVIIEKALDFSISSEVRSQDTVFLIGSVLRNPFNRDVGLEFIRKNWKALIEKCGKVPHLLTRLIGMMDGFVSYEVADEIEKFFKENPVPEASRTIEQVLERIRARAFWLRREKPSLEEWLRKY